MEMRVEVVERTHPGSTSEVRKSPAGSSRARGSRWSESVGRVASGLREHLVSIFFPEGDHGEDDSMNTFGREICIKAHGKRTESGA